jgi:ribonuclease HII
MLVGCDEVGRGVAAGPLVVCGVLAPKNWKIAGLKDSKQLSDKQRRILNEKLRACDIKFIIVEKSNEYIDQHGLGKALRECFEEVFSLLSTSTDETKSTVKMIVDGNCKFSNPNISSIVKADQTIPHVQAAAIIAKVFRDDFMISVSNAKYSFDKHKGYLTEQHLKEIATHGLCNLHRKSVKIRQKQGKSKSISKETLKAQSKA